MALTEENQLKVCKILNVEPSVLEYQLTLLSTDFTSTRQTAVEEEIARWDGGVGTDFVDVDPNARNFGSKIRSDREKNDIRKNIAILLERPEWANGNGITSRVQRG